jgi:hypothetical protein
MTGCYFHDPDQLSKRFADRNRENICWIDVFHPETLSGTAAGVVGEIDGDRITRVDVHLSLRAFPIRVGYGRGPLESRGQSAAAVEVPQLRPIDLACGFTEAGGRQLNRAREERGRR